MKNRKAAFILLVSIVFSTSTVLAQEVKQDVAFLESLRTEVHPDRDKPEVPDDITFKLNVIYGSADGRDLTADIFTPVKTPENPRPAIVFLHGGSWMFGDPSQFHYHAGYLASRYGFFAMSVDYRLSGEAQFPAALQDAKCAVRWVRSKAEEYNIDPERIVIAGGSAGGHLSSMMLTTAGIPEYEGSSGQSEYSSHVNLGVLFNGEFDMWDLVEKGSLIGAMEQFMGGKPDEIPGVYSDLSSVHRIHQYVPPVLLLHGMVDNCVSHDQSIAFYNRLNAVGGHAEIALYNDKPHAWFNREPDRTITVERMERFLVEQLHLPPVEEEQSEKELMKLSSWDRGISIHSPTDETSFAHLWFYEWHLFDAVLEGEHTHGSHDWEWTVSPDGAKAEMNAEWLSMTMNATDNGADVLLKITNASGHDWPEIAAIIPCFNPGHEDVVKVNPLFLDEEHDDTYFLGESGLELIKGEAPREIHFNQDMLPAIMDWEKESDEDDFVFSFKWPTSERNAEAGLLIRESDDKKLVMGIAWDSYISVQGHNPWHCMHLSVRVGPLMQGETKTIHGKIYLFEGNKEDCLSKYLKDFRTNDDSN